MLALLVLLALGSSGGDPELDAAVTSTTSPERSTGSDPSTDSTRPAEPTGPTRPPTTATTATPSTAAPATVPPGAGAVAVTSVIDGDTIDVAGGERVRLIGIDSPERGACGYAEASAALRSLIGRRPVVLVPGARDDRDRYGRLLRYVEVDGVDANLEMLRRGHAIARYDSRDGYGRHAREDAYVAASNAAHRLCDRTAGAPRTTLAPDPALGFTGGAGGTDPRFGTCRAAIAAGYGPYVRGVDPEYDWYSDADRDGTVCER